MSFLETGSPLYPGLYQNLWVSGHFSFNAPQTDGFSVRRGHALWPVAPMVTLVDKSSAAEVVSFTVFPIGLLFWQVASRTKQVISCSLLADIPPQFYVISRTICLIKHGCQSKKQAYW